MAKLTRREYYLCLGIFIFFGLFVGMVLAQNATIDQLQDCREKLDVQHYEQCGPRLVNAPGQDVNLSDIMGLVVNGE